MLAFARHFCRESRRAKRCSGQSAKKNGLAGLCELAARHDEIGGRRQRGQSGAGAHGEGQAKRRLPGDRRNDAGDEAADQRLDEILA